MKYILIFASIAGIIFLSQNLNAQQIVVRPYLQPGNTPTLSKEQKVLIWQTDSIPSNFKVTYNLHGSPDKESVKSSYVQLKLKGKTSYLYRATLNKLQFDTLYHYEVHQNNNLIARDSFHTRTKKPFTRFAVLGDFGAGTTQQAAIAYRIAEKKPQFVITTGDNAYQNGLEEDYRKNVFPYYLPQSNGPAKGAALMNSIPFYMVLGNHDVRIDSLNEAPGAFAYFYYSDLPLNGPVAQNPPAIRGSSSLVKAFNKNTKPRFPRISNFSFDYGNVHFICLDANEYVNPLDPALVDWLNRDIGNSKADWKIVVFHHPGFNSSKAHYDFQLMRLLAPVFEKLQVNLVLTGHVHNYQRSVPLTFLPAKNATGDRYMISPEGRVNGTFTLDTLYNGETITKPKGIIYIVTGAGGGGLYDPNLSQKPELWKHDVPGNWVPFTKKLISDRHSFTLIETDKKLLTLKQIDLTGKVIDQISITR
ncbi:MAG TPA: metallophosphoesterase family protein [Cyclobacteriaceae bacterium]|nr:metallophosphoesterase family protein [Cyclobacteriaceae bacterium]